MHQHDGIRVRVHNHSPPRARRRRERRVTHPITINFNVFSPPPFPGVWNNPFAITDNVFELLMMNRMAALFTQQESSLSRTNRKLDITEEVYIGDNDDGDICAVCQSEFAKEENVSTLECNHLFHFTCIEEWGRYKPECPTCRRDIPVLGVDHGFGEMNL